MSDENERDVINLLDEEGNEHEFEIIDAAEYNDQQYLALVPIFDNPEDNLEDEGDLILLRVNEEDTGDGEQYLEAIEDEAEYEAVAAIFMERLQDEFDFEGEDGEDAEEAEEV